MNDSLPPSKDLELKSLHEIKQYLKQLRAELRSGKLKSQEINFIPIFHSIQEIVTVENLRNMLSEFESSSELFSKKIEEIRAYISTIGGEEQFEHFIKSSNQEILSAIFQSLFNPPLMIEDINLETLFESFTRLSNRKIKWDDIKFPEISGIPNNLQMTELDDFIDDVHFERDLEEFERIILPTLPQNLSEVLKSAPDGEMRYNYFVFCLYLIQRKKIVYDKKLNELKAYNQEEKT